MPRTRRELPREAKVDEIVALAAERVRTGGLAALSMAEVARDLGLAQAAVYWYFPTKDHLFVAALRRLVGEVLARKPPHRVGLEGQVIWWVDRLDELSLHRAAVRERARTSAVVAEFEHASYDALERMLRGVLGGCVPDGEVEAVARTFIAAADGILLRRLPRRERDPLILFALHRLTGGAL